VKTGKESWFVASITRWATDYVVFIVGWKPMFVSFIIEWKPLFVFISNGNHYFVALGQCLLFPWLMKITTCCFLYWMEVNDVLYGNSYQDIGVCKELRRGKGCEGGDN